MTIQLKAKKTAQQTLSAACDALIELERLGMLLSPAVKRAIAAALRDVACRLDTAAREREAEIERQVETTIFGGRSFEDKREPAHAD